MTFSVGHEDSAFPLSGYDYHFRVVNFAPDISSTNGDVQAHIESIYSYYERIEVTKL